MTDALEGTGSFSDPSEAARFRDVLGKIIDQRYGELADEKAAGVVLDIYQGGAVFNSAVTVPSSVIPRTKDNPERGYVAKIRLDDKYFGEVIEARIDPNLIPVYRKAEFFDESSPAGSGVMVDRLGRYVNVAASGGVSSVVPDSYPSLVGTTLLAPQVAPRVAVMGSKGVWKVTELIRGVLASEASSQTLMIGPDYARFNTETLRWGGSIAFSRGTEIKVYEITTGAPIITYGGEPLESGLTEPVEIVLGQRSGSMYVNFDSTDGDPVLVWVESGEDIPIPPEWYLVFSRINEGSFSSKLIFASLTDFKSPSAPGGFVANAFKVGFEKYQAQFQWTPVTMATNGESIIVDKYEVWGTTGDEDWRFLTSTQDTQIANVVFDADTSWHFRVRAIGSNGIPGVFSNQQPLNFPAETEQRWTKTYWQDAKPLFGKEGDEWFDTANDNAHYIYSELEDDYVYAPFGGMAIAEASIGNAHIVSLSGEKLEFQSVGAEKIRVDEIQFNMLNPNIVEELSGHTITELEDTFDEINLNFQSSIKSVVDQYAISVSDKIAPTTGWSTAQPSSGDGIFIWRRAVITYGDGSVETSSAVLLTGNSAALLSIESLNGYVFKNSVGSTVLTVKIYYGSKLIGNLTQLHDTFGTDAYLEWSWRDATDSTGVFLPSDPRISNNGFTLAVAAGDVVNKVTYTCSLKEE